MKNELRHIASQFDLAAPIAAINSLGDGFINDTFIVRTEGDAPDYILQRKNRNIFPDVPAMMEYPPRRRGGRRGSHARSDDRGSDS